MRHLLVAAAIVAGLAQAQAAPTLDRSTLSIDENVMINTICGAARSQGGGAYDSCVGQPLAALAAHPSPDRSGLSATQNKAVGMSCDQFRRVGIGEFNECLSRAMAKTSKVSDKPDDDLEPHITQVFATTEGVNRAEVPPASPDLPRPHDVLVKRPDVIAKTPLSPAQLYKAVEKSVWVVLATPSLADARARNVAQGSAVAVSDNLLLTNCHVVDHRPLIKIMQDETVDDATIVAQDVKADRCVIKAKSQKLTPVRGVSTFDNLAVGERVFAIGAPRSLERTLSEGLVSGLRHQPGRNLVQTSAAISPGSSGGGLFDDRGNLIGITEMQFRGAAQNLNFAGAAADFWN